MLKDINSYEELIYSWDHWYSNALKNPLYLGKPENSEGYYFSVTISIAKHFTIIGRQIEGNNKHEIYAVAKAYDNSKNNDCNYLIRKAEIFEADNVYAEYPKDCKFTYKDKILKNEENIFFNHKIIDLSKFDKTKNLIQKSNIEYNMDMNCTINSMQMNFSHEYKTWEASWFPLQPNEHFKKLNECANSIIKKIDFHIA